MNINAKTKVAGVIGDPIGHTLSPLIHNTLIKELGINAVYTAFCVKEADLLGVKAALTFFNMAGINVTVPHKTAILPYLDECDELAQQIGAVNTVVCKDGKLTGYNTDASGFLRMLLKEGIQVQGKKIGIIGAGGAARAVAFSLKHAGAKELYIINRSRQKADALAHDVGAQAVDNLPYDIEIIVNTTSVGMYPDVNACPIESLDEFTSLFAAVDIIYRPKNTQFLNMAKARGIKTVGGISMLVYQAVEAFERFFDTEIKKRMIDTVFKTLELTKNIVLTGFMSTGKSTVGKILADKLSVDFVDIDEAICRAEGMTIPEIFKQSKEAGFREIETKIIKRYEDTERTVISLGGGAVLKEENMAAMRKNGIIVCLSTDIDTLVSRFGGGNRPLGDGKSAEELKVLYESRKPYYDKADIIIDCNNLNPTEVAEQILYKVYNFCGD